MVMRTGAIVMLDALGFKGIWKRYPDPQVNIDKMRALRKKAEVLTGRFEGLGGAPIDIRSSFVSDTIGPCAIAIAAQQTSLVIEEALKTEPSLAYRGCIAYGSFEIDYPFLLGEAVDEAAEHHERAEGALIWLAPSALALWRSQRCFPAEQFNMAPWDVPLKGIGPYRTLAIHPFDQDDGSEDRDGTTSTPAQDFPPQFAERRSDSGDQTSEHESVPEFAARRRQSRRLTNGIALRFDGAGAGWRRCRSSRYPRAGYFANRREIASFMQLAIVMMQAAAEGPAVARRRTAKWRRPRGGIKPAWAPLSRPAGHSAGATCRTFQAYDSPETMRQSATMGFRTERGLAKESSHFTAAQHGLTR
jgi:hypothetical protein